MYKYINIGEGEQTATYDSVQTNLGAGPSSGLLMGALGCDEMRALLHALERTDEPPVHPQLQCTLELESRIFESLFQRRMLKAP